MPSCTYSVTRPKGLDAELLSRRHLDKAEHLFEGQITGPEAFALYNGAVYTGIHGGFVVQIDEGELKPVVKFGQNCGKKLNSLSIYFSCVKMC